MSETKFFGRSALTAALLLAGGCFVQSLQPFYTKNDVVKLPPELVGQWQALDKEAKVQLKIEADGDFVYTEKSKITQLRVVFFKIDDRLFMDMMFKDFNAPDDIGDMTRLHLIPVHSVWLTESTPDKFSMRMLSPDWIEEQVKAGKFNLPCIAIDATESQDKDKHRVFNAAPEQWREVLKIAAAAPKAFSDPLVFGKDEPTPAVKK